MRRFAQTLVRGALLLLLGACATAPEHPEPAVDATPRAVALQLSLTGKAEAVAPGGGAIPVAVARAGFEPVLLDFQDRALSVHDLPPGRYEIAAIGPLSCTGLGFEIAPGSGPVSLGTLQAQILRTDYDVALLSHAAPEAAELAELGGGAEAGRLTLDRYALCHAPRDFDGPVWEDLPMEQKLMFGLLMAGFCAAAVATGNICAF